MNLVHQSYIFHELANKEIRLLHPAGWWPIFCAGQSLPPLTQQAAGLWTIHPYSREIWAVITNTGVHVPFGNKVFSRNMHKRGVAMSYGNFILLLKELPYCSPYWLYQFTCPLKVQEGSLFSTLSPWIIFCRIFDDSYSDWCEVIPHCSFDLHFSNN